MALKTRQDFYKIIKDTPSYVMKELKFWMNGYTSEQRLPSINLKLPKPMYFDVLITNMSLKIPANVILTMKIKKKNFPILHAIKRGRTREEPLIAERAKRADPTTETRAVARTGGVRKTSHKIIQCGRKDRCYLLLRGKWLVRASRTKLKNMELWYFSA